MSNIGGSTPSAEINHDETQGGTDPSPHHTRPTSTNATNPTTRTDRASTGGDIPTNGQDDYHAGGNAQLDEFKVYNSDSIDSHTVTTYYSDGSTDGGVTISTSSGAWVDPANTIGVATISLGNSNLSLRGIRFDRIRGETHSHGI